VRRALPAAFASAALICACGSNDEPKDAEAYLGTPPDGLVYTERSAEEERRFKSAFGGGTKGPKDFAVRAVWSDEKTAFVAVVMIARFRGDRDIADAKKDYLRTIHAHPPETISIDGEKASLVVGEPGTVFVVDSDPHTLIVSAGEDRAQTVDAARGLLR
jgi:hypothetical protein